MAIGLLHAITLHASTYSIHIYHQPGRFRQFAPNPAPLDLKSISIPENQFVDVEVDPLVLAQCKRIAVDKIEKHCLDRYSISPGFKIWLALHPETRIQFWLALSIQYDNIPSALQIMDDLRTTYPERMEVFSSLAIATALVWDDPDAITSSRNYGIWGINSRQFKKVRGYKAIFDYFSSRDNQNRFVYPPNQLPVQALVHLVDQDLDVDEMNWIAMHFQKFRFDMQKLNSMMPYDVHKLTSGTPAIGQRTYSIENLLAHGGLCGDQAWVLTRMAKSFGIPAMKIRSSSMPGRLGHAWSGHLLDNMNEPRLSFTGKTAGNASESGWVFDPQTRTLIKDTRLNMVLMGAILKSGSLSNANFLAQQAALCYDSNKPLSKKLALAALRQSALSPAAWQMVHHHFASRSFTTEEALSFYTSHGKVYTTFPDLRLEATLCIFTTAEKEIFTQHMPMLENQLLDPRLSTKEQIQLLRLMISKGGNFSHSKCKKELAPLIRRLAETMRDESEQRPSHVALVAKK